MRIHQRLITAAFLAVCGLGLWSCAPDKPAAPNPAPPQTAKLNAGFLPPGTHLMNEDAIPRVEYLIQLTAYRITVPAGAVSRSDEFWKHIDEHAVDVPTYELLYKNGVRVGVAASSEWDYLKDILKQNPAITQPSAYTGREAKDIEMELKLNVPFQNLFYSDTHGDLVGRTFERCDNVLRVSFQPAPRKPGSVRLALCPVVRSLRERLVAIGDVNTRTIQFVHPEQFFELNLTVDIPFDGFLVVAPSEESKWGTSLGNNFLVNDGVAEQNETLLIFRPTVYRQRPTGVAATQP